MATSNTSRFLKERYIVAIAKFGTDRHEDALTELSELLMDEALHPVYRLKANAALADGVDDWFLAEQYRLAAERTFDDMSEVCAKCETDDDVALELAGLRELLDEIADEQERDNPSHHEVAEAIDTELPTLSTTRATENTTSPAHMHVQITEAQDSQQESQDPEVQGRLDEVTL